MFTNVLTISQNVKVCRNSEFHFDNQIPYRLGHIIIIIIIIIIVIIIISSSSIIIKEIVLQIYLS